MAPVLCALMACPALRAQEAPPQENQTLSVFVPDSSAATERFALAQKLQGAREWTKTAEIYQELIESFRDRVVGAGEQRDGLYISVAERVIREVSQWPAEGLSAYNGRFGPVAMEMLSKARTPEALRQVVDRYLLTDAGRTAATQLVQVYWKDGDVAAAGHLAQRVAATLPLDSPLRPALLLQAGLAWQLAGVSDRARQILDDLQQHHAQATGLVAGEEANLLAALQKAMDARVERQRSETSWTSFGGPPDRAKVPDFAGRSDALLFWVDTAGANTVETAQVPAASLRAMLNQNLGVFPVYDNRELFFQDGVNLHAISIDGGMRLPGWPDTSIPLGGVFPSASVIRTLALAPDAVYVALADAGAQPWTNEAADGSSLLCVNRHDGQIRWRTTASILAEKHPSLKATQFASPPLVVGDRLYVTARGGRNAQFHDVYALCFDRGTGELIWSSYVASGPNVNMLVFEDPSPAGEGALPHLSFHAQRLIVVTNVGVVAALEASDGTPAWLRVYERIESPSVRSGLRAFAIAQAGARSSRIFASSPAIIDSGRVFALPVDSRHVLALDELDGRLLKQIPRASLNNVDTLVGLMGENLVVAGEHAASAIAWAKASEDGAVQNDAINWTMDFPGNPLRGRPFLTADSLFLPTDERLLRVATDKWKIQQTTPPYPATWEDGQGPGNVLVTQEHVVVATQSRVNVYTNLEAATARLDREAQAAPESSEPLIRYGELLFAAGKYDASLQKFAAALEIATRGETPGQLDRIFAASLTAASRAALRTGTSSPAGDFLKIAQGAISSPVQAVQYHLSTATLELRSNNGAASLASLQAILEDPSQRGVLHRDGEMPRRHAGEIARRQIIQLMDRFGPAIYASAEQRAREKLAQANAARDPAALMEVAMSFPNSAAAPDALLAAGKLHEDSRHLADATAAYRLLVQEYSSHTRAPEFIEALARIYAATPGKANIAASRLAHAAANYGDPPTRSSLRLSDGSIVPPAPFSEVAKSIREAAGLHRTTTLPDFGLPARGALFAEPQTLQFPAERILPPVAPRLPDATRCVVVNAQGDIAIFGPEGKQVGLFAGAGVNLPADYLWLSPQRLCIRSGAQLKVFDLESGTLAWSLDCEKLPPIQQLDEPLDQIEDDAPSAAGGVRVAPVNLRIIARPPAERATDTIRDIASVAGKVIVGTGTGRIAAIDSETGGLIWQVRPESGRVARLSASDDFTAARIAGARRSVVACMDNGTGRIIFARSHRAEDAVQNCVISDDGQLVYSVPSRLISKDLFDQSDRLLFDAAMAHPASFTQQEYPDQLILCDDVIVASTENGTQVRLFDRFTGQQIAPGGGKSDTPATTLLPKGRTSRTRFVPAPPYVYAHNQASIAAINLQRAEPQERRLPDAVQNLKAVLPSRGHLVAVEQPFREANSPTVPEILVMAFSRNPTPNGESGRLDHRVVISQDGGISAWQMLENGLILSTGDGRLVHYPVAR